MRRVDSIMGCESATFQITVYELYSKRAIITACFFNSAIQNADHTRRPASNRLVMSNQDDGPALGV